MLILLGILLAVIAWLVWSHTSFRSDVKTRLAAFEADLAKLKAKLP